MLLKVVCRTHPKACERISNFRLNLHTQKLDKALHIKDKLEQNSLQTPYVVTHFN